MAEKKQPIPKRVITEADVDRIMRTAPDYITEASDEVKDLFVAAEWAKEERDLSPKRYFDLVLNEGTEEEKTIYRLPADGECGGSCQDARWRHYGCSFSQRQASSILTVRPSLPTSRVGTE